MKITKAKLFITILTIAVLAFGVYNILWFRYVSTTFDPFLNSSHIQSVPDENYDFWTPGRGGKFHSFRDVAGKGIVVDIVLPGYLTFGGNVSAITTTEIDEQDGVFIYVSECAIGMTLFPRNMHFLLKITDYTTVEKMGEAVRLRSLVVDSAGTPLLDHPLNNIDPISLEEELILYNKFYTQIETFFENIHYIFGDALKVNT
ncbi:MAG: hypothetical protein LBD23_10270 [Oscillospiraceae bacterium]|jgi:hypothetical protein|nr:hypothetical protein [Oscillospiraceae bacterium]